MKINLRTRIKYKDQEYSSPEELPAEARAAYEAALKSSEAAPDAAVTKIVFNGQEYSSVEEMPAGERQLYQDAMKLARDSGMATPTPATSSGWSTKRQWQLMLLVGGLLLLAVLILLLTR